MKDENRPEPYEVMNEGDATQFVDKITKVVSLIMLILIGVLLYALNAGAAEGHNWCSDWQDGYEASFYLMCRQCQSIEPKECPEPEPTDSSGYMRGVKDGAADGKQKREGEV